MTENNRKTIWKRDRPKWYPATLHTDPDYNRTMPEALLALCGNIQWTDIWGMISFVLDRLSIRLFSLLPMDFVFFQKVCKQNHNHSVNALNHILSSFQKNHDVIYWNCGSSWITSWFNFLLKHQCVWGNTLVLFFFVKVQTVQGGTWSVQGKNITLNPPWTAFLHIVRANYRVFTFKMSEFAIFLGERFKVDTFSSIFFIFFIYGDNKFINLDFTFYFQILWKYGFYLELLEPFLKIDELSFFLWLFIGGKG